MVIVCCSNLEMRMPNIQFLKDMQEFIKPAQVHGEKKLEI